MITDLNLNPVAWKILRLLAKEPYIKTLLNNDIYTNIIPTAWYNGRERGVCLRVEISKPDHPDMFIVFGENRNSDDVFVDSWIDKTSGLNPPNPGSDSYENGYENRVFVTPLSRGQKQEVRTVKLILKLIKRFGKDGTLLQLNTRA